MALEAVLLDQLRRLDHDFRRAGPAARSGQIDDLVIAVATAVWWGERLQWIHDIADRMLQEDDDYDDTGRNATTGY